MRLSLIISWLWASTVIASPTRPTKSIAGVTVIDTPLVQAAQQYTRAHSDDFTFNQNGKFPPVDLEVHALSSLFHNLGWDITSELISPDKRFEVDGAIAAQNWIEQQKKMGKAESWDTNRIQLVWDAIALHTTPSISAYKEPVVGLTGMGVAADFQGPKSDVSGTITIEDFNTFKTTFPRLDLAGSIRDELDGFCRTKPNTTHDNFQQAFGTRFVDNYTTQGHLTVDIIEGALP